MSYEFIKDNHPTAPESERVEIIARILLQGGIYLGDHAKRLTNRLDDGSEFTSYGTNPYGNTVKTEDLFYIEESDIRKALEAFREKGWHAYYDSEVHEYAVCRERKPRGAWADMHTSWIF